MRDEGRRTVIAALRFCRGTQAPSFDSTSEATLFGTIRQSFLGQRQTTEERSIASFVHNRDTRKVEMELPAIRSELQLSTPMRAVLNVGQRLFGASASVDRR